MKIPLLVLLFLITVSSSTLVFAQQSEREQYEQFYRSGEISKSLSLARRVIKKNSADWHAHYYAGLSLLKQDKEKDAITLFEKAVSLNPEESQLRTALSYAYMLRNDRRATTEANKALELNKQNAEANYVLAVMSIRDEMYSTGYEHAKAAIAISPNLAAAYLAKSQSLISSFMKQTGTILRPADKRYELLAEASDDIDKYLALEPNGSEAAFQRTYAASLRFFADYYADRLNRPPGPNDSKTSEPNSTPLRITHKVKAQYSNKARNAGVSGMLNLLVEFAADGRIGHILVVKPLGYGLDEQAIAAARKMRFEPERLNGIAVSTVRPVSYSFNIY